MNVAQSIHVNNLLAAVMKRAICKPLFLPCLGPSTWDCSGFEYNFVVLLHLQVDNNINELQQANFV